MPVIAAPDICDSGVRGTFAPQHFFKLAPLNCGIVNKQLGLYNICMKIEEE